MEAGGTEGWVDGWHDYRDLGQNCRAAGFAILRACRMLYLVIVRSSNLFCLNICVERSKTSWPSELSGNFTRACDFLSLSLSFQEVLPEGMMCLSFKTFCLAWTVCDAKNQTQKKVYNHVGLW